MLIGRPAIGWAQPPLQQIVEPLAECPAGHVGHPLRSVRRIEPPYPLGEIEPRPVAA